ncbi:MAG TPA: isocitrate lyase/phosphoenolpyruvate mutase family protein [Caulobacter sp.]|nr:isocitrate lyase/phosphoenolpyruvate mutase family protein [Caulobacter sp.]
MTAQAQAARRFRALHKGPGFIMPNAWDAGTARLLAAEGFAAIATTSAGVAFSLGKPDYGLDDAALTVSREAMLARVAEIAAATELPVNADLEAGWGDDPETVAQTIRLAVAAGAAGGNIEDIRGERLYDEALAVERIAAARAAAPDFVLTARTDVFQGPGEDALAQAIRRGNLFLEAGADCVFPPGAPDLATIRTLAREIAGPVNIVVGLTPIDGGLDALFEAGVRRISVGGSIARAALGLVRRAAADLKAGRLDYASDQIPQGELNALFSGGTPAGR